MTQGNHSFGKLKIFGVALLKILKESPHKNFNVLYEKGIGVPMIQNILEIFKSEIRNKIQGTSVIPLEEFTIFITYFENDAKDTIVIIYLDEKDNTSNYSTLYLYSKKIRKALSSDNSLSKIAQICDDAIEIPHAKGITGLYVILQSGVIIFSKTRDSVSEKLQSDLLGGFISALFSFSEQVINGESGAKLKEINFGNQSFYTITKNNTIFTFLVTKMSPLLQRYMYIIVDKFLDKYEHNLKHFDGDLTRFHEFNDIVDQYFIIEKKDEEK